MRQVLAAFDAPSPGELRRAQRAALGRLNPARAAPDQLARALAWQVYSIEDLPGWNAAVRAVSPESAAAALKSCRDNAAWAAAGPPGTMFPVGAEAVSLATLLELRLR